MGVHDTDKYGAVRELLGIPAGEPIFIIRAQDKLAEGAVGKYQELYFRNVLGGDRSNMTKEQRKFHNDLDEVMDEIWNWQEANEDKVKVPD